MQKGKWKSAGESIRKALRKDTLNAEAKFLFSWFYFSKANPDYQIDSAYHYVLKAITAYSITSPREKERLRKFPLYIIQLISHREEIDTPAFAFANHLNSQKS